MSETHDGPCSSHFRPLPFKGNTNLAALAAGEAAPPAGMTEEMLHHLCHAPRGSCVAWGIPFEVGNVLAIADGPVSVEVGPIQARWIVFLHTSDMRPLRPGPGGIISPLHGQGMLAEHAADYVLCYADGSEARATIRRRHQVGPFQRHWGENCFQCVAQHKPQPNRGAQEQLQPHWGLTQIRATAADEGLWVNWVWAWENPHPERAIAGLRFEPGTGVVVVSAISVGDTATLPLRWQTRRKARLALPEGEAFQPDLDQDGLLAQIQLDLGQVISATPRLIYPNDTWPDTYNNQLPQVAAHELIVEYTAHPDACFHLSGPAGSRVVPVSAVEGAGGNRLWVHVADAAALLPPGSPVDLEARARASSLYLPEEIVAMLPPALMDSSLTFSETSRTV